MQLLRYLRRQPLLVLGLCAVTFVGWLLWDTFSWLQISPAHFTMKEGQRKSLPRDEDLKTLPVPMVVKKPVRMRVDNDKFTLHERAQLLSKLKPGMTRTQVEELVGTPAAQDVHPATIQGSQVTYRMTYDADLTPPATIRPIRPYPTKLDTSKPQLLDHRMVVTLEFDASKPGHPLLGIYYPDPLF